MGVTSGTRSRITVANRVEAANAWVVLRLVGRCGAVAFTTLLLAAAWSARAALRPRAPDTMRCPVRMPPSSSRRPAAQDLVRDPLGIPGVVDDSVKGTRQLRGSRVGRRRYDM